MAQTAIPGLEVIDPDMERMARRMRVPPPSAGTMYGTPQGVALDPGAAEAVRRTSSMRIQQPLPPEAKFQGPQQPLPESRPWTATDGTARPPETVPAGERIRGAGAATGQGIKTAGQAAGEMLKSAGRGAVQDVLKGGMRSTGILSGISETAGHGNAYFDDNVPLGDKLRIGATDLVATAGSTLGAVGGGLFGAGAGSVVPGPGTVVGGVAGGVAGGYAGHKAGRAAGNFLFGGDEALQRHGYDPQRGIVDVAKSAINGEDSSQTFGRGNAAAGNGRGFVNPPLINPDTAAPQPGRDAGGGRGFVNPPLINPDTAAPQPNVTTPPNPAGTIRRDGNSYSGTDIKFGADITNARNPGVGVTSLDMSEGRRQDAMELARMRAAAPQGPTMGGFAGGEQIGMAREGGTANFGPSLSVLGPSGSAMKPRDIRAANALAAERATATERMANERNLARMREGGDMARANLNAGVARENNAATIAATMRGQDITRENNAATIAATMRGQDITREGHMVTAQGNRMRMQYDMAKDQRDYTTGRADKAFEQGQQAMRMQYDMAKDQRDYTTGRADKAFEQGQQAIKDLHSEIGSMIPPTTDRDGKTVPDTQNAARYATAMQALVGRMGKTMKDVDAKDKARFVAGMQLADVASATATGGLTPWGTRAIQSNEPILALRKLPNGDYQTNRVGVNGETEIIPGRYIEKEGSTLGFGGRASNKFKALME